MTDEEALIQAIIGNSDDDTPRLVYADYIQERGEDERAEFIRIQCEIYRGADPYRLKVLKSREAWLQPTVEKYYGNQIYPLHADFHGFSRGFPLVVTHNIQDLKKDWPSLLNIAPFENLTIDCRGPYISFRDDLYSVDIDRIKSIVFRAYTATGPCFGDQAIEFLTERNLPRLQSLSFVNRMSFDCNLFNSIAESPLSQNLCHLRVDGNNYIFHDESLTNILQNNVLSRLELINNGIGGSAIMIIAQSGASLTEANLYDTHLGDDGARCLANAANLTKLRSLCIAANRINEASYLAIAGSHNLPSLEELVCVETQLMARLIREERQRAYQNGEPLPLPLLKVIKPSFAPSRFDLLVGR